MEPHFIEAASLYIDRIREIVDKFRKDGGVVNHRHRGLMHIESIRNLMTAMAITSAAATQALDNIERVLTGFDARGAVEAQRQSMIESLLILRRSLQIDRAPPGRTRG